MYRGGGGQNVPRGGGELATKVVLGKLGLLTPKLRNFSRISVEKDRDPRKFKMFTPPSNFRRLNPPYPGLQPGLETGNPGSS